MEEMKDMLNTNKPNAGTTEASKLSPDEQMIQDGFNDLLQDQAFNFAKQAHDGVKRRSGEPYIMHPIAVAKIVCSEMGLGSTSICAALLHDVVEDTEYTVYPQYVWR